MCVKIVAECNEYELLETVAIQDTQEYSSSFDSIPMKLDQKREKDQRSGLLCQWTSVRSENRGAVEDFFDLGFAATVKTYSFSWPVHSSLSLDESLTFSWYCMRHEFGIR